MEILHLRQMHFVILILKTVLQIRFDVTLVSQLKCFIDYFSFFFIKFVILTGQIKS